MRRMELVAIAWIVGLLIPGSRSAPAQESAATAEIKFADESAMLGNRPPKPKEMGEKSDPAFMEWPFDILFLDATGNGRQDLFMMDHHGPAHYRLWRNQGQGKLVSVDSARLAGSKRPTGCFSLLAYDFSGTGAQDVFNTYQTQQYHYTGPKGGGPETFAWVNEPGLGVWTIMLSDFDGDGFVDAAAGPNRDSGGKIHWGAGEPWVKDFKKTTDAFVGFHSATADMNGDGWPDIVASNFGSKNEFWIGLLINDGKGNFKDMAAEAGLEAAPAGGAIILADFNNDGLMDIYLCGYPSTKKSEGAVKLYLNQGNGRFKDVTEDSGLNGPKDCWQTRYVKATAADFDNDGLIDIVMYGSTGYKLYQNLGGGKFKDVTATCGIPRHYGGEPCATAADYDDDGLVDLAMLGDKGVWLGRNVTQTSNGWLKVRLIGPKGNPEAAGASVTLYAAGHLGEAKFILGHQQAQFSSDFHTTGSRLHFGLGQAPACDVRVTFPGGKTVELKDVKARARIEIKQP